MIIQAYDPGHYAIRAAAEHDAECFYREELQFREEAGYPPFTFLAAFSISGLAEQPVRDQADESARLLARLKREMQLRTEILGPAPSPIYRLRNRFRRQILVKGYTRGDLHRLIGAWRQQSRHTSTVRITVDIDPLDSVSYTHLTLPTIYSV